MVSSILENTFAAQLISFCSFGCDADGFLLTSTDSQLFEEGLEIDRKERPGEIVLPNKPGIGVAEKKK